jgi:hypothetical protein
MGVVRPARMQGLKQRRDMTTIASLMLWFCIVTDYFRRSTVFVELYSIESNVRVTSIQEITRFLHSLLVVIIFGTS